MTPPAGSGTAAEGEPGRVLALDFGSVRTGLAVSDPTRTVASPLAVVQKAGTSEGMATIAGVVSELGVTRVVVGLPVGPSGETAQTARSRSFADRLRRVLPVPVELHDERYTSVMADRTTAATGTSSSRDSLAACHLLESWMEEHGA